MNPGELIKAGAFVAFSAQPSAGSADREVFSYNGTTFVQLSNIADSNNTSSSPSFLTFFGGRVFFEMKDKELADLCVRAYNDFVMDEWCAAAPDIFVPELLTTDISC